MKLMIAIPTLDYIHTEFVESLLKLTRKLDTDGVVYDVRIQSGTLVYMARNKLAHAALDEGYTHMLWLDSDMVFTENALDDLMFAGKKFVSCIYHARRRCHESCLFESYEPVPKKFQTYPQGVFEIAACGFGGVFMDVQVIRDIQDKFGSLFTPLPAMGEDVSFCKRARETGYKLYADSSVVMGHIGHITIYPEDYERWKDTISNYDEVRKLEC